MVNDVTIRVEAAHGSKTDIRPIVDRIISAIATQPAHPVADGVEYPHGDLVSELRNGDSLSARLDAADLITAYQQTVDGLRAERDRWRAKFMESAGKLGASYTEIARLREALEPFSAFFDKAMEGFTEGYAERQAPSHPVLGWNDAHLLMSHFLAARAALSSNGGK